MRARSLVAWVAFALAMAGAAVALVPPRDASGFDVTRFAALPVLEGGRVKPIDSVARNSLLAMSAHQSLRDGARTVGPDEWLLDVLFRPEVAFRQKVFQIDDPGVLGLLGLPQTSERYFALETLAPRLEEIEHQARAAEPVDPKRRTPFQSAILTLYERLSLYYRLQNTIQLAGRPRLLTEIASASSPDAAERRALLAALAHFRPIPPPAASGPDAWRSTGEALRAAASGTPDPALAQWGRLGVAWADRDSAAFAGAVSDLERTTSLAAARLPDLRRAGDEVLFNRAQPFYSGMVIYVLALLVLFASWLRWGDLLRRAAYGLLVAGALVHTAGLVSRVLLQGRPPVTNLYSSAVFVGWAAVVVGVVLERVYRRGFGTAVAAASGFASLLVAHHLATDGDTMEMMRAVLDSNFWLATHVVTITIGYAGTFLAGAIAIGWAVREHAARQLDPATTKALSGMVYGVVCFALFFSFVGTVLGGIWADQSWGRFWGWDPKENGALLIVLWNAIILHARFGGYVRTRGIMAMAIFGNVITSLSWFGVNMLGVGLHSYGFMDKAFWALAAFDASQIALLAAALVPRRFWRRARERGADAMQQA